MHSERLEPEGSYISEKFTDEGMIIDHWNADGEIIATSGKMYDEITETLQ